MTTRPSAVPRWAWWAAGISLALAVGIGAIVFDLVVVRVPSEATGTGGGTASSTTPVIGSGSGHGSALDGVQPFSISGTVDGLYPGGHRPLTLTFANPNSTPIRVVGLSITVADATAGCPANVLTFGTLQPLDVPGGGATTSRVDASMSPSAGEGCRGVSWRLTYSGRAVVA